MTHASIGTGLVIRLRRGCFWLSHLHGFVALLLLVTACAGSPTVKETLSFPVSEEWQVGNHTEMPGEYSIIEFVPKGQTIEAWQELLTLQNFVPPWGGPTPADALEGLRTLREQRCPGSTVWRRLSEDSTQVTYEWQSKPCLGFPEQHELGKIVYGNYNRFVLRYTYRGYEMPAERRTKWMEILALAEIETTSSP